MTDDLMADKVFLALVVWREARGEEYNARVAVANSILNRVHKPSWWGNDVLSVVGKKFQYSSLTNPGDPQLILWPKNDSNWQVCLQIACDAIYGRTMDTAPGADSYWDSSIMAPKWATADNFVCKIGKLSFHNTDHDHEAPKVNNS